jgi:hypothetical protein
MKVLGLACVYTGKRELEGGLLVRVTGTFPVTSIAVEGVRISWDEHP